MKTKSFKKITLVICLCMGWLLVSLASAQTILLSENFEGWTLGKTLTSTTYNNWTGNDDSSSVGVSVVTVPSGSSSTFGTQSLYLSDNSSSASANAYYNLENTWNEGYVEFSAKSVGGAGLYIKFFDAGSYTTNYQLAISSAITLYQGASTSVKSISLADAGYTAGTWATFRINFNETNNTVSVLLNGVEILSLASGEADAGAWQVGKFQLVAGYSGGTGLGGYFDNITVAVIPEGSTIVLSFLGGILLLGVERLRRTKFAKAH